MALVGGLQVIASRSPIHSAIGLVTSFLSIAGLYVLLHAEFVAAVQVLVYAGGIMVLFLFVILLANLRERSAWRLRLRTVVQAGTGLLAVAAMLVLARRGHGVVEPAGAAAAAPGGGNLEAVGAALFTDALLPFEIASLLLLVAMVAAIVLARDLGREEG
ncbi:MAG TPA: NADH-quinone oxidoreductase subunit J [Candidatus Polarisedimenticolia bacterium]|nr:NADH-quinone oxidoreductase subunit J [Candidatus Polarisedimenticolia bacterium]